MDEVGAEDGRQGVADVVGEGCGNRFGGVEGHPVAWRSERCQWVESLGVVEEEARTLS